jgi:putative salt-induced outer membrane protein
VLTSKRIAVFVVALVGCGSIAPLRAQPGWSTRGEAGFVAARGNTSTQSANLKFEIVRESHKWKNTFGASGLYGKTSAIQSAQRWDARDQLDYLFSERSFWFGGVRYEDDRYSGFDYQESFSTGVGRKFIDTENTKLAAQLGVGYRALAPEDLVRDETGEVVARIAGSRDSDLVGNGALAFEHSFNNATKALYSLLVESGKTNTLTKNDLALQVKMTRVLAISLGVSVRYNSFPQDGLKKTDTLSTVNIVYVSKPGA